MNTCTKLWRRRVLLKITFRRTRCRWEEGVYIKVVVKSSFFWDVTQRRVVILYRRFGTTYRSGLQGSRSLFLGTSWALKMGRICCPETSVQDHNSTLRNTPEECRSRSHRGGSLKSCNVAVNGMWTELARVRIPSRALLLAANRFSWPYINWLLRSFLQCLCILDALFVLQYQRPAGRICAAVNFILRVFRY
jgi:hypothetical protein